MKKNAFFAGLLGAALGVAITLGYVNSPESFDLGIVAQAQPPERSDFRFGSSSSVSSPTPESRPADRSDYTSEESANIRVYEAANESVVNINTSMVQYDRFFMLPIPGEGSGSGSVLDKKGHILTNFHVVQDADEIEVTLSSGVTYPAELVGFDEETDIAVVKIDAPQEELKPIRVGWSQDLKVGQRVFALGNPFGLSGTLTTGIISSLNRTAPGATRHRSLKSLIQTDAAMNPGNSGGPLLDTNAQLIGMNIAIASKTGQNAGVGFAIPANRIRRIVPELIEHGKVVRPDHGIVSVMPTNQGLKIVKLNRGGPADQAGLRGFEIRRERRREGNVIYEREYIDRDSADSILGVNDEPTRSHNEFLDVIEKFKPGDTVTFRVLRDGREIRIPVTLGEA